MPDPTVRGADRRPTRNQGSSMASSKTSTDRVRDTRSDSIGWRWRWQLRRLGRQDGRQRNPDPAFSVPPVRTATRRRLEATMRYQVETVWAAYAKRVSAKLVDAEAGAAAIPLL